MVNIFKNYDETALFTPRNNFRTRGNEKNLKIPTWRKDIRRHSFAYRNLNEWNKLPNHVVNSPSLNSFKAHLDLYLTDVWRINFGKPLLQESLIMHESFSFCTFSMSCLLMLKYKQIVCMNIEMIYLWHGLVKIGFPNEL